MKLSEYAKRLGITYKTAWNYYKAGQIKGAYALPTGTIIVPNNSADVNGTGQENNSTEKGVILYARTSSTSNKKMLEEQAKRLEMYAIAKGYKIKAIIKEFGSGLNDNRRQLMKILQDDNYDKIIVEHKDRLTRFGFNYIQTLTGNRIEVINETKEKDEDLTQDLISIIHSFSARLYGLRKSNRLNIKIQQDIENIEKESDDENF